MSKKQPCGAPTPLTVSPVIAAHLCGIVCHGLDHAKSRAQNLADQHRLVFVIAEHTYDARGQHVGYRVLETVIPKEFAETTAPAEEPSHAA